MRKRLVILVVLLLALAGVSRPTLTRAAGCSARNNSTPSDGDIPVCTRYPGETCYHCSYSLGGGEFALCSESPSGRTQYCTIVTGTAGWPAMY